MARTDKRKVVGEAVHAKACHIVHLSECSRRFGSNAKTKMLDGRVVEVIYEVPATSKGKKKQCFIVGDWQLGSEVKRMKIGIRLVQEGPVPGNEPPPLPPPPDVPPPPADVQIADQILTLPDSFYDRMGYESEETKEAAKEDDSEEDNDPDQDFLVAFANGRKWYDKQDICHRSLNGKVSKKEWCVKTMAGDRWTDGCDKGPLASTSRLDYFLELFPPQQVLLMIRLTNTNLQKARQKELTKGELVRFFGVLINATRFKFGARRDLWSNTAPTKYIPAPSFGKTGMTRARFDISGQHLQWSEQPQERPPSMSIHEYRWRLVDDHVDNFNDHRARNFVPIHRICVDESISRWYGQGGSWINHDLPHYVDIDRKPESGAEIQNAACGTSGVMIHLKLVKGQLIGGEEDENEEGVPHGGQVMLELVEPWYHTDRIVCGDSFFASVRACIALKKKGL